jgi:hypothetical protein
MTGFYFIKSTSIEDVRYNKKEHVPSMERTGLKNKVS